MKKILACAVILCFTLVACKKSEEKKSEAPTAQPGQKQGEFKPQGQKKKQHEPSSLKIFNEQTLVSEVPQAQYGTIATSKVKIGNKQVQAVLLKDLLTKYNI